MKNLHLQYYHEHRNDDGVLFYQLPVFVFINTRIEISHASQMTDMAIIIN